MVYDRAIPVLFTLLHFLYFAVVQAAALSHIDSRADSNCSNTTRISEAYTPRIQECPPDFQLVRSAGSEVENGSIVQELSSSEKGYISARDENVIPESWEAYLGNVLASSVNLTSPIPDPSNHPPG